jgi:hypothetical protein
MTLHDVLDMMLVLYKRRINDRIVVRLGQCVAEEGTRSQFLVIVIEDEGSGRWISLRLSTFRKILKFVAGHGFEKARRLTDEERKILQRKERNR